MNPAVRTTTEKLPDFFIKDNQETLMKLSIKGISKSFGAGNVLDAVDFEINTGEICALLGENGAGKSTLMNIVGGVFPADAGEILLDGEKVNFPNPAASQNAGIAFIHQELNLVNDLTVYENMFLGNFPKKGAFIDRKQMIRKTRELFDRLGIDISPTAMVSELDASYKQMVEIACALLADASVIIMDEPTASLTGAEIERVFAIMRTLKTRGISMIFISHKLDEVMQICDRYAVLRNGKTVNSGNIDDVSAEELAAFMVGHEIKNETVFSPAAYGDEILRLESLSDEKNFKDISLSLHRGEVLGVTGLLGDKRSEIFGTVFGIYGGHYTGKIILDGKEIHPSSPHEGLRAGIAYLPKNRKENAIIEDMSILDNGTAVTLEQYSRFGFLKRAKQKAVFDSQVHNLQIKMSCEENLITSLSGGNQQKVVLAKWLISEPKVLILDNPTQGVDVGAKEEIYSIIRSLAESGIAVIVLSSEGQEIMRICDRAIVLCHGRIAAKVSGTDMNEKTMMVYATGAGKGEEKYE